MAKSLPIRMEATILDSLNVVGQSSVYALIEPTATFSDIISTLNTWLADLDACTAGQILSAEIEVMPTLPGGLKPDPVTGSRIEQTGLLNFSATGTTHLNGVIVPALSDDPTVIAAGKPVLTTGSPLDTLSGLLAGGGTASHEWTNAWAQTFVAFVSGLISFRPSNRQLARQTFEEA